jgi:beta-1,4-N-acetylglucosaminyltransferase
VRLEVATIPRARSVGQGALSAARSTLLAAAWTLPLLLRSGARLVLVNGPGTCLPLCVWAWLLSRARVARYRVVFVESFCRTRSLSLTGRVLYRIADRFFVMWPSLAQRWPRAVYLGPLV